MSNVRGKIFCQRCKSPNELGEDLCGQCGTRLMLLVEPSAARFEGRGTGGGMEEHLLERVTAIETHISRVIDKLEKMAELMLKQSRSAYFDHELLDTLITVLGESGVISRQRLAALWRERRHKVVEEGEGRPRFEGLREGVLGAYEGDEPDHFRRLVGEGFGELEKGKEAAGLRKLERAAALAPGNAPLNAFLGEHLFRKGKTAPAHDYLLRAATEDPGNARLRLLLGLACADEGDFEHAREFLKGAARELAPSFAAHCGLGLLAAAASDWKGALAEFKLAAEARPVPEAHYLAALANFRLGRLKTALRHLRRAVGLDARYAAAHYLTGLALTRVGEPKDAAKAFAAAASLDPEDAAYRAAEEDPAAAADAPDPFSAKGRKGWRLLTGGDARVAAALLEDALGKAAAL